MVNWTEKQEEAIYESGRNILVSAAAGSGKTAVLVERIIQKMLNREKPVDIDSLLVVTFTNAAAQEMRTRVGEALEEALVSNPSSHHLKKQLSLLQRASISTLHSFCMEIVRQHAYLLDLDPRFRIANETEADHIKQEVLEDLFEKWYGSEEINQAAFFDVVDRFSSDRNDVDVEELILSIYNFAIQNPWPEIWLDQIVDQYTIPEQWTEEDIPWLEILKQEVKTEFDAFQEELTTADAIIHESDGPYLYAETIEKDKQLLQQALENIDTWEKLRVFVLENKFSNLKAHKAECNKDKQDKVKALRDSYKDRWKKMQENWFKRDLASHVADMRELTPVIKQLAVLVKEFKERFTIQKKEKGLVDFSDLEHYCLELLIDDQSTEYNIIPSSVAQGLQKQYSELLVDEYQDTNLVQETIITMVSEQVGAGNMFMVGDVKQSIYRFRHAEPTLFINKYKRYVEEDSQGKRIDLSSNFRSREQVLVGVNYIFRQILNEKLGEINYDEEVELIYANQMYESLPLVESEPEFIIIDENQAAETNQLPEQSEEDYVDLETAQLEARIYAQKIKAWIGGDGKEPFQVVDKATGKQRDIQYRDIVILMRAMSWAPTIVDEFKKQGIPIYAELAKGYFDAIEVKIMINYLKIIDNPRQDVPLASVLRSPMVGLDEEELASVRLADQNGAYYDALTEYKSNGDNKNIIHKINRFMDELELFRHAARQGALSELIWSIYRETGYYDYVGGMPGGKQRQANLRALYDRARGYETTSFRGLFRFLRFIERMEENNDDLGAARALSEQEDVVRMTTIHKSKGLEFPVVIVGGMNREFNTKDTQGKFMLHKDLGFATKYIDPVKRIMYPTLFYQAMKQEKKREMLAEEMRVLYVALTRAKEKLVMVGSVKSFEKKQLKWEKMLHHPEWVLPAYFRSEVKSYLDWVGPALIRHQSSQLLRTEESMDNVLEDVQFDPSKWMISIIHGSELVNINESAVEEDMELEENVTQWEPLKIEDQTMANLVNKRLSYQYPFNEATQARAKQTVTELKKQQDFKDEYSSDQIVQPFKAPIVKRPAFMQDTKKLTGAETGTAMHTVMQHIPFNSELTAFELSEFVESLVAKEIITQAEADVVDISTIGHFLETDIAKYMMSLPIFHRELPFSLTLPAEDVYANWKGKVNEQVLIQGVLDCVIPWEDGWIILDYKTDAIDEAIDQALKVKLIKRYDTQMKLYKRAIETIWKQPVKAAYLYFFSKELLLQVPTEE